MDYTCLLSFEWAAMVHSFLKLLHHLQLKEFDQSILAFNLSSRLSVKKLFQFQQISPYLVAISKVETEIVTGVTGIVVAMFDKKYGKLLLYYISMRFFKRGIQNN